MNFLALIFAGMLERETRDAGGSLLGNDLDALDYSGNNFVFDAGVKSFGGVADDDQVDARIAGRNMRQVADGTEVGEEVRGLTELHVDTGKAATEGCSDGTLQADASALDGLAEFFGNIFLVFFERFSAGCETFPFEFDAGGFKHANRGLNDFGADAVAGDESYLICHSLFRCCGRCIAAGACPCVNSISSS